MIIISCDNAFRLSGFLPKMMSRLVVWLNNTISHVGGRQSQTASKMERFKTLGLTKVGNTFYRAHVYNRVLMKVLGDKLHVGIGGSGCADMYDIT